MKYELICINISVSLNGTFPPGGRSLLWSGRLGEGEASSNSGVAPGDRSHQEVWIMYCRDPTFLLNHQEVGICQQKCGLVSRALPSNQAYLFNRPGVAGAVLQTPPSFID